MHSGIQTPKPGWLGVSLAVFGAIHTRGYDADIELVPGGSIPNWSGLQYQCWYQCIYQGMTNIPDQHWFIPTWYKAKMSLEPNTRTWYESSKKDPIPRAGWYEDFYNTQYQNQRAWWVQKLDTRWLWPGVSNPNNGNGPNEAPESSANFFFLVQSRRQPERASTLAACAKFKCKTVDKPLVLTSDPKKERKSKRAFERFLTVSSNPKWRINSFHILGVCCRAWCQSFFFFLTKAMCTTREIWLLSI